MVPRWVVGLGVCALVPLTAPVGNASSLATSAPATVGGGSSGWVLSTRNPAASAAAPAYVGNGYVGTRVPAAGAGFVSSPFATETHIAGVYADIPDLVHGGIQRQGSVNLPGWTQLDVTVGGATYAPDPEGYTQALDLRTGVVTTRSAWVSAGRRTDLRYQVTLDRARKRVGLVRLRITPQWSGKLTVTDTLGAGASLTTGGLHPVSARADADSASLLVRASGTGTRVAEVAALSVPAGSSVSASAHGMTATREVQIPVRAGESYLVTKVVGFATSLDSAHPAANAAAAARTPAGSILAENARAWAREWRSDIRVDGDRQLQRRIRAAMFYLLASVRPRVQWSLSPVGLSAGGYNNHVFWDAETWMYPSLLAQHPDEAGSVVGYRYRTRDGARRNAARTGYAGMRFAWESAQTGDEVTPTWAETGQLEQHITADVALAQWQYYLATGNRDWLRTRGWPILAGAADFWASRVTRGDDGRFHINVVEGPDEQNWPVDDEVYTNATAIRVLRIATRAAGLVDQPAPARWARVADGLVVLRPRPLGGLPAVRPEFRGYAGQQVKQADAVLLTYPWEYPQSRAVDRSDLDYYTPRYDPDGPAMTDSVNSIVAAQLGQGCADYTYTLRSLLPFVKPPYEQFTEARSGQGVFTFLTGEGGFLQEFLYGYSGLRWRANRLHLDPTLPPQLPRLSLVGLHWQGRTFDVVIKPETTTVTLRTGPAIPLDTPQGPQQLTSTLTLPTRSAQTTTSNLALCRPVRATAEDPSLPAVAAVDGSKVTAWSSGQDPQAPSSLTVRLGDTALIGSARLTWLVARPLGTYSLQARSDEGWVTVANVPGSGSLIDRVRFDALPADALRLRLPATRSGGLNPQLAELVVTQ